MKTCKESLLGWSGSAIYSLVLFAAVILSKSAAMGGVLQVHPVNWRYFSDGSGRAIYLAGHQSFVDLQDNSFNKEFIRGGYRILDWNEYLRFLESNKFNYLRNWIIWSTGSGLAASGNHAIAFPMPYLRVGGHGKARDGGDKFDLYQFDERFLNRMQDRCEDLQERGIYVSVMLFEVYGFLEGETSGDPPQTLWDGNVFNGSNNINGIDTDENGDGKGIEFFYTEDKQVRELQLAYVRKVIDTVNHLDNIFYEIANELYAPDWQREMIKFIKNYEKDKPKQHLVFMSAGGRTRTGGWRQMPMDVLLASEADCFSVAGGWDSQAYGRKNPPANQTGKPGFVDMDHVAAGSNDVGFVWTAFTRGYNFNLYDKPFESPDSEGPQWRGIRRNVGQAITYALEMDLAEAAPHGELASTGFCLALPGEQYVVYQPEGGNFEVKGLKTGKRYRVQWYDTENTRIIGNCDWTCTEPNCLFTPDKKAVVLFLYDNDHE